MTTDPQTTEPIRKSSLPPAPPPEWEFHTWFPRPDGGGDMVPGERQRGVLVRRRVAYGDWEPVRPDCWADEPAGDVVPAVPSAPADRGALRDCIAEALISWSYRGQEPDPEAGILETVRANAYSRADALLAVLPPPVDRGAVLRAAAAAVAEMREETFTNVAVYPVYDGSQRLALSNAESRLRRMADEAQQPEAWDVPDARPGSTDHTLTQRHGDEAQQAGMRSCGHDDYHDPHPWHERPDVWCPGIGYDEPAVAESGKEA